MPNVNSDAEAMDRLHDICGDERSRILIHRTEATRYSRPQFRIEVATREYVFELGTDHKWRWVFLIDYGRTFFVTGKAADATGYPINDPDFLAGIEDLAEWRA